MSQLGCLRRHSPRFSRLITESQLARRSFSLTATKTAKETLLATGARMPNLILSASCLPAHPQANSEALKQVPHVQFDHSQSQQSGVRLKDTFPGAKPFVSLVVGNCVGTKRIPYAIEEFLKAQDLNKVDLCILGSPFASQTDNSGSVVNPQPYDLEQYLRAWQQLEDSVSGGLCASVGVQHMTVPKLKRFLDKCKVRPVINQVEMNPYIIQRNLRSYCSSEGLAVSALLPFGGAQTKPLAEQKYVTDIATELKVSPHQVLLAWHQSQQLPVVMPASTFQNLSLTQILEAEKIALTPRHVRFIGKLDEHIRSDTLAEYLPRGSKDIPALWDEPQLSSEGVPVPGSVLCDLDDIKPGSTLSLRFSKPGVKPFSVIVLREVDCIPISAFQNWCPHRGHVLDSQPSVLSEDGELLICGSHFAKFLVDGGVCVEGPCQGTSLIPVPVIVDAKNRVIMGEFKRTAEVFPK